ncbi:hypothetical protein [Streptomyces sp. NBC_01602]|uniref:hypothetical protein n=1 Tax=Streptomyces sp. NBC_01602 TaxID=2975893 RepID=UPI00386B5D25
MAAPLGEDANVSARLTEDQQGHLAQHLPHGRTDREVLYCAYRVATLLKQVGHRRRPVGSCGQTVREVPTEHPAGACRT